MTNIELKLQKRQILNTHKSQRHQQNNQNDTKETTNHYIKTYIGVIQGSSEWLAEHVSNVKNDCLNYVFSIQINGFFLLVFFFLFSKNDF